MYALVSFLLAVVTGAVLMPGLSYLEDNSRFFESVLFLLSYFSALIIILFYVLLTFLYLILFYQYERKRYLAFFIKKITKDVQQLAEKHIPTERFVGTEFEELSKGIQEIIDRSNQAIEEVQQTEQFKNELVTNVAHDLRSPLTSILGYLELINNDRYRDEVELRYYVQVAHDKAIGLHTLIHDIFEYTYMQNQQVKIQQDPIHIEEMLNQLAVQSRVQIEEAGMEYRLFYFVSNPIVVGDGGKLARVFENLIQNAIRYGSDGKYLDIKLHETERMIEIEIINYGLQAIPPMDLPRIFERFYRVEKSRSHFTGGSGLGLAITKSIIELHGGEIDVMSIPGRTAFTIRLLKEAVS